MISDLPLKDGITKSGEANFGGLSAHKSDNSSEYVRRLRQTGYIFLVRPSPIDNPPAQKMNWDCCGVYMGTDEKLHVCGQKFDNFADYMRHSCSGGRKA